MFRSLASYQKRFRHIWLLQRLLDLMITRMHSSRMSTVRSSSRSGAGSTRHPPDQAPPRDQTPPRTRHPPTRHPPGSDTTTPAVDRQTPVNILPCPKLRLRAVINVNSKEINLFQCFLKYVYFDIWSSRCVKSPWIFIPNLRKMGIYHGNMFKEWLLINWL